MIRSKEPAIGPPSDLRRHRYEVALRLIRGNRMFGNPSIPLITPVHKDRRSKSKYYLGVNALNGSLVVLEVSSYPMHSTSVIRWEPEAADLIDRAACAKDNAVESIINDFMSNLQRASTQYSTLPLPYVEDRMRMLQAAQ